MQSTADNPTPSGPHTASTAAAPDRKPAPAHPKKSKKAKADEAAYLAWKKAQHEPRTESQRKNAEHKEASRKLGRKNGFKFGYGRLRAADKAAMDRIMQGADKPEEKEEAQREGGEGRDSEQEGKKVSEE